VPALQKGKMPVLQGKMPVLQDGKMPVLRKEKK
jgi:hypothetical protein